MLSVEEALNKILGYITVLDAETQPVLDCQGQVLAEDVFADIDIPPLDNSSMDGFAVRAADTIGASRQSPRVLRVIDMVMAGDISRKTVAAGSAIRIMTGAALPAGADSVIKFEDTDVTTREKGSAEVALLCETKPGRYIRRAGEDIARGSLVLSKNTVLKPAHAGVLASLGRSKVTVVRRPRVAILATGNELTDISQPLAPGKQYNSNTYSLAAQVKYYGGIPLVLGIALDSEDSITEKLYRGLEADILITTGGVSMGDYDLVRDVLMKRGEINFWSVRMKPGKPMAFGAFSSGSKKIPHLGLPGNPVSAMITFEIFARPAILKMMGKTQFARPVFEAVIEDTVRNEDGRRIYARAIVEKRDGEYFARTTGSQSSGVLTSMSLANGLVIVPEDTELVKPGDKVNAMLFDWNDV